MNHDHIRSTNLRFNLEKESQRRAWEYLQGMDKAIFKSYSNANKEMNHGKREKRVSDTLRPLGRYQNVYLTKQELTALQSEFSDWSERIERLSSYMASTGRKYQNHAATIRLWAEKDKPATARRIYECEEDESL